MNHLVWIVLDSARFDAFSAARTPALDRLGAGQRRWSYASWTVPSHHVFLMGLLPHANKTHVVASTVYRQELSLWSERLGLDGATSFRDFLPALSLPAFLRRLGYRCEAYMSLPVLNPATVIARDFQHFELLPFHNDIRAATGRLDFDREPLFCLINTGETHYPYALPHESPGELPLLSGLNGVWRDLDDFLRVPGSFAPPDIRFDEETLRPLWRKQVSNIEWLDAQIGDLIERAPANTWFIVTSDHGELFGEGGWFGHGPIVHEKAFEVFLVEGLSPRRK